MTWKRVWGYFSKQQNFFIFDDEIDLFRNYCRELSLFYDGIKFNIWFWNLDEQKFFLSKFSVLAAKNFPFALKKFVMITFLRFLSPSPKLQSACRSDVCEPRYYRFIIAAESTIIMWRGASTPRPLGGCQVPLITSICIESGRSFPY